MSSSSSSSSEGKRADSVNHSVGMVMLPASVLRFSGGQAGGGQARPGQAKRHYCTGSKQLAAAHEALGVAP
jgi:hypothetical protein